MVTFRFYLHVIQNDHHEQVRVYLHGKEDTAKAKVLTLQNTQ
jgi:hypothetical protein